MSPRTCFGDPEGGWSGRPRITTLVVPPHPGPTPLVIGHRHSSTHTEVPEGIGWRVLRREGAADGQTNERGVGWGRPESPTTVPSTGETDGTTDYSGTGWWGHRPGSSASERWEVHTELEGQVVVSQTCPDVIEPSRVRGLQSY